MPSSQHNLEIPNSTTDSIIKWIQKIDNTLQMQRRMLDCVNKDIQNNKQLRIGIRLKFDKTKDV